MNESEAINRYFPKLTERGRRWVRFLAMLAGGAILIWIAVALHKVLTPIVAALAIAYILNPLVTVLEQRYRIRRVVSVCVGLGLLVLGGLVLCGLATVQVIQIANDAPTYARNAIQWIEETAPAVFAADGTAAPATQAAGAPPAGSMPPVAGTAHLKKLAAEHALSVGRSVVAYISTLVTNVFYWLSVTVLLPLYTFFFLWHFNDFVQTVRVHLPAAYRETIIEIVSTIDEAISSFFRGRLLVCLALGVITGVGWLILSIVGYPVPYNLALGFLVGLANLVPFLSLVVLPPVLLLTYLEAQQAGVNWAMAVTLVVAVYMAGQAIEAFLLTPAIQARTSGLHPVTNVVALLIGAELAGFLGLLLAIPIASTLKSLAGEYVLPEVRRLAGLDSSGAGPSGPAPPGEHAPAQPSTAGPAPGPAAQDQK